MDAGAAPGDGLRILFCGLPAGVSAAVLRGLLAAGQRVVGVVTPAAAVPHLIPTQPTPVTFLFPPQTAGIPLITGAPPADLPAEAWAANIPVLAMDDFAHADAHAALAALQPDVACVACFTRRIPLSLLALPRLGFLNIHPSLLPAYRGPTPFFWQLRDGAATGVTVHYMDEGLDTGDIAAQATVPLPDGTGGPDGEQRLMMIGLELLLGVLDDLAQGIVRRRPQPPGSYFGLPADEDFTLSTDWPARRAYNFMRGTADRRRPYPIQIAGRREMLAVADHFAADLVLDRPSVRHGRNILIRFNPGILYARTVG